MKRDDVYKLKKGDKLYQVSRYDYTKRDYLKGGRWIVYEYTIIRIRDGLMQVKLYMKRNPGDDFEQIKTNNVDSIEHRYGRTPAEAIKIAIDSEASSLKMSIDSVKRHRATLAGLRKLAATHAQTATKKAARHADT